MAQSEMDYMNIGKGNVIGIDVDNVIYQFTSGSGSTSTYQVDTWTATEDCIVAGYLTYNTAMSTTGSQLQVDDQTIYVVYTTNNVSCNMPVFMPVKKGQKVSARSYSLLYLKAYAPKY